MKKIRLICFVVLCFLSCKNGTETSEKASSVEKKATTSSVADNPLTKDARQLAQLFCDDKQLKFELDSFIRRRDAVVDTFNRTKPENISENLRMSRKKWIDRVNYQNAQIDGLSTFQQDIEKTVRETYKQPNEWAAFKHSVDSLKGVICH